MQKCSFLKTLVVRRTAIPVSSIRSFTVTKTLDNENNPQISTDLNTNKDDKLSRRDFRYIFPEFLPDPNPDFRNALAERLQRRDLLSRRDKVEIPGILEIVLIGKTSEIKFLIYYAIASSG